jgi:hypothetical protein
VRTLDVDEDFVPCPVADGDELFANGTFVFDVTRILEHVRRASTDVALVKVAVSGIPRWDRPLDDAHVPSADLARPVVLAEISPGNYNLIDGHHRVEKARRSGVDTLWAYALTAAQHVPFLTSTRAYQGYVAYWNGKVAEREEASADGTGARREPA